MKNQKTYKSFQVPVFMRIWAVPTDWGDLRAFILKGGIG
jgi:hypothetical protein